MRPIENNPKMFFEKLGKNKQINKTINIFHSIPKLLVKIV